MQVFKIVSFFLAGSTKLKRQRLQGPLPKQNKTQFQVEEKNRGRCLAGVPVNTLLLQNFSWAQGVQGCLELYKTNERSSAHRGTNKKRSREMLEITSNYTLLLQKFWLQDEEFSSMTDRAYKTKRKINF
jgi:hypothetical protein